MMNSKVILVILAFMAMTTTTTTTTMAINFFQLAQDEWEGFKLTHNKSYGNVVEEKFRMKIWMENRRRIARHNKNVDGLGFNLGMNKYGDLLPSEINALLNGFRSDLLMRNKTGSHAHPLRRATFIQPENVAIPPQIDWREKGAVTGVKDQGQCGSCWAFSTTGSLEGQNFRKTGKLVSLSEQNLVDCSTGAPYQSMGCDGGLVDDALTYVHDNQGIDTEVTYPYEARNDICRYRKKDKGADDSGIVDIPVGHEEALLNAVATVGPVSVAIDASHESFHFYKNGIYYESACGSSLQDLDHAVLVVGYGTENGNDYWLVKNSWGVSWGDHGYIKMSRNRENNCGIAGSASYPLV